MSNKNDILSAVAVILFGAAFYAGSFRIQQTTSDVLGSRFFPQTAAVLLILLGIAQIITAIRDGRQEKHTASEKTAGASAEKDGLSVPLLLTVAALFAYYVLIQIVGFTITSIAYLLFESFVLMPQESRNNKKMKLIVAATSILVPLFLNYVFYYVFSIQLPQGSLFG